MLKNTLSLLYDTPKVRDDFIFIVSSSGKQKKRDEEWDNSDRQYKHRGDDDDDRDYRHRYGDDDRGYRHRGDDDDDDDRD